MSTEKVFVDGMIARRNDQAPEYVLCNLSLKVGELAEFMQANQKDGWVNVRVLRSKAGKVYAELDTWSADPDRVGRNGVKQVREALQAAPPVEDDDIPF